MVGTIDALLDKGFGFLRVTEGELVGKRVFFHSGVVDGGLRFPELRKHDVATFELDTEDPRGPRASFVQVLEHAYPERYEGRVQSVDGSVTFIERPGERNVFAHVSEYNRRITEADVGLPVEFSIGPGRNGKTAAKAVEFMD